jgi:cell division protein ZapA
MAEVTLDIGGRLYDVHCRDGEERQLQRLAAIIDDKTKVARRASAGLTEVRQLLFAAILLADELDELHAKGKAQGTFDLSPASGAADDPRRRRTAEPPGRPHRKPRAKACGLRPRTLDKKVAGTARHEL